MESRRITTSYLCSTSRLAFSITISATWTCRVGWFVESGAEMTSPWTERSMSVTSSGRSSMSSTMSSDAGMVLAVMAWAMSWRITVLPVPGRTDDQAALPLADGRQSQIQDARWNNSWRFSSYLQVDAALQRIERRQVVEQDLVPLATSGSARS